MGTRELYQQAGFEEVPAPDGGRPVMRKDVGGHADPDARAALEEGIFGKHVLITDHDDWPAAEVIAGYIEETVLVYPSTGGRPKARRMSAEFTGHQPRLYQIFGMARWAPKS